MPKTRLKRIANIIDAWHATLRRGRRRRKRKRKKNYMASFHPVLIFLSFVYSCLLGSPCGFLRVADYSFMMPSFRNMAAFDTCENKTKRMGTKAKSSTEHAWVFHLIWLPQLSSWSPLLTLHYCPCECQVELWLQIS